MGFYFVVSEFAAVQRSDVIITNGANVASPQSPLAAGHHGASYLAAQGNTGGKKFLFGVETGKARNGDDGVVRVEADADKLKQYLEKLDPQDFGKFNP